LPDTLIEKEGRGASQVKYGGAYTFVILGNWTRWRNYTMRQIPVKIMKLHPDAVIPGYARPGDAGFDLIATEDVLVQPGETVKVPTGLAFAIPEGYELQVRPRSGISLKTKLRLSNSPGTIDSGYRGEVAVLIDNISLPTYELANTQLEPKKGTSAQTISNETIGVNEPCVVGSYLIRKGDRIAQGVISEAPQAEWEVVNELDETERGAGGFGSSGVTVK
jgi:dUTP pyrophosphatase